MNKGAVGHVDSAVVYLARIRRWSLTEITHPAQNRRAYHRMSSDWNSELDPDSDIDFGELEDDGPTSRKVYHASGTQSSVYRQLEHSETSLTRWVAVKTVSFIANTTKKPHDVVKEAKLLIEQIRHPNVRLAPKSPEDA